MSKNNRKTKRTQGTEVAGVALIAVSFLLLLCMFLTVILGPVGKYVKQFMLGAFGLSSYAYLFAMLAIGVMLVMNRQPRLPNVKIGCCIGIYVAAILILHLITSGTFIRSGESTYGSYLSDCYETGATFGGVILGVIVYPVALMGKVTSYILYAAVAIFCAVVWMELIPIGSKRPKKSSVLVETKPEPSRSVPEFHKDPLNAPKSMTSVGARTLFVSEIDPSEQKASREIPPMRGDSMRAASAGHGTTKQTASEVRLTATMRDQMEEAHTALYTFRDTVADKPSSPYLPPYIKSAADAAAPVQPVQVNHEPTSTVTFPSYDRPAQVVHRMDGAARPTTEGDNAPKKTIIDGEQRSRELAAQKLREQKQAEADRKVREESLRAQRQDALQTTASVSSTTAASTSKTSDAQSAQSRTQPTGRKFIIGDLESEKLRAQRAAQQAAAQQMKASAAASPQQSQQQLQQSAAFRQHLEQPQRTADAIRPSQPPVTPPVDKTPVVYRRDEPSTALAPDAKQPIAAQPSDQTQAVVEQQHTASAQPPVAQTAEKKPNLSIWESLLGSSKASQAPLVTLQPIADTARAVEAEDEDARQAERIDAQDDDTSETRAADAVLPSGIDFDRAFGKSKPNTFDDATAHTEADEEYESLVRLGNPFDDGAPSAAQDTAAQAQEDDILYRDVPKVAADVADDPEPDYIPPTQHNLRTVPQKSTNPRQQLGMEDYAQTINGEVIEDKRFFPTSGEAYVKPEVELLMNNSTFTGEISEESKLKAQQLEQTLKQFNVPAQIIGITRGPAVTRYELSMPPGVSVSKISNLADDIAYSLAATSGIRIEAPIPGMSAVGVEVPNEKIDIVSLREIIESKEFQSFESPLGFVLGKDIAGKKRICDLFKMPHLLIAGATGSGKSSCLNSLITSLIYKTSPEELRLMLIDPKQVEFVNYEGLPHMLLEKAITSWQAALLGLEWIIKESERRFTLFSKMRVRELKDYLKTAEVQRGDKEKLPYIIVIIDELANLISESKKDFEDKIRYITQKSRAAGIHIVVATQRPSVDTITGTIKANLTSRIAFAVTSPQDSKTVLDQIGAETLLGRGDMLYAPFDQPEPVRIQGAYVTSEEVTAVVETVKSNNQSMYDSDIYHAIYPEPEVREDISDDNDDDNGMDELTLKVLRTFIESGKPSISSAQRRYRIGFNRAANIVDYLEVNKFISPGDGPTQQRQVLITLEEFIAQFGDVQ